VIVAIGNAPSSGSTFLSDLLDSLPFAVCGPEINLFSVKAHFSDFSLIQKKGFYASRSPIIYQKKQRLLVERLCNYGIDQMLLSSITAESKSFKDFCLKIFEIFSALRGKQCRIFFEKTPQNIHCAGDFLDHFRDGYFFHITRNPLFVYKSLLNRNFPPYIAMNTWLIDESSAYTLFNHPRFITIKYEKLVQAPFEFVCRLLERLNIEYDPRDLEEKYQNNIYRKLFSRKLASWTKNRYGIKGNANDPKRMDRNDLQRFRYMMDSKINKKYAGEFGLPEINFKELLKLNGYLNEANQIIPENFGVSPTWYDLRSAKLLFGKYLSDLRSGRCRASAFIPYLSPANLRKKVCAV
jgi:hypothetical protein